MATESTDKLIFLQCCADPEQEVRTMDRYFFSSGPTTKGEGGGGRRKDTENKFQLYVSHFDQEIESNTGNQGLTDLLEFANFPTVIYGYVFVDNIWIPILFVNKMRDPSATEKKAK